MPQKKDNDEGTVSDQEIWSAIRYLDPDTKSEVNDIVAIVTLTAIFSICLACILKNASQGELECKSICC
jgi:hypothetical protein